MSKRKTALPEVDVNPAVFLKVYDASIAARLDMNQINKLIEGALRKHHGLTYAEARMWWAHHLIQARPLA